MFWPLECHISYFLQILTSCHSQPKMNWLDFTGQSSKVIVTSYYCECKMSGTPGGSETGLVGGVIQLQDGNSSSQYSSKQCINLDVKANQTYVWFWDVWVSMHWCRSTSWSRSVVRSCLVSLKFVLHQLVLLLAHVCALLAFLWKDKMFQSENDGELLQTALLFRSFIFLQWPLWSTIVRRL